MRRKLHYTAVCALTAFALITSACGGDDSSSGGAAPPERSDGGSGSGSSVGVTDSTITISLSGPRTGPIGSLAEAGEKAGMDVWLAEVNANGGINGRQVKVIRTDNQFTPDGAIAACEAEKSNGSLMVVISSGYSAESTCLDGAGVPSLVSLADQVDPKWSDNVHYVESVRTWGSSAAEDLHKRNPDAKVGMIFLRDLAYGFEGKDAFVEKADELGIKIVGKEGITQGQASFVSELQRLESAGADTISVNAVTDIIGILRDAASIGYKPDFIGSGYGSDEIAAAVGKPLMGVRAVSSTTTTESPAFADYAKKVEKYGADGVEATAGGMSGYGLGVVLQKVLEAAGKDLTRASLAKAFKSADGFESAGIFPHLSWAKGLAGTDDTFSVVCCDDQMRWKLADGENG